MKLSRRTWPRLFLFAALVAICAVGQHSRPAVATPTKFDNGATAVPLTWTGGTTVSTSTITIGAGTLTGNITHVRVKLLGVTHPHLSDVTVALTSGNIAIPIILMTNVGSAGGSAANLDFTFDDHGLPMPVSPSSAIYQPTIVNLPPDPPYSGLYTHYLSFLDGTDPNTTWTLQVFDSNNNSMDGTIAGGWELYITTDATVNASPSVNALTVGNISENGTISAAGSFTDTDSSSFTATVDYGDGSGTQSLAVDSGTKSFTLSHQYLDNAGSPFQGSVTLYDEDGASDTEPFSATVTNVSPSSVSVMLDMSTVPEGGTVMLSGTFADPGTLDTHTVDINWNDGGPHDTLNLAANDLTIPATAHTYTTALAANAARTITVTVTDKDGGSNSGTTSVTVTNEAPAGLTVTPTPASVMENGTVSLDGSFTDGSPTDTHSVDVDWGDGSMHSTTSLAAGVLTFSGLTHQYLNNKAANADYTVTVTVTDSNASATTATTMVGVTNVAPSGLSLTPTPASVSENDFVSLDGSFTDPGTLDTHDVDVDWGDGSTHSSTSLAAGVLTFSGLTHQYLDNQPANAHYTVTVTVTDSDGDTTTNTTAVSVVNVDPSGLSLTPSPSTVVENGSISLGGSFTDPGSLDTHDIDVDWGDGSTHDSAALTAGVLSFSGLAHQYLDNQPADTPYTITVIVTDNYGASTSATTTVTVTNAAPSGISLTPTPGMVAENGTISLDGSFTDPGTLDTHDIDVDWGDGSPHGTTSLATGVLMFTGMTHQYLDNKAGNAAYTVTVVVTDKDAATGTGNTSVTVTNVSPANVMATPTPATILENGSITLDGSFTDPGTLDTHSVDVDWGDGSMHGSASLAAGVLTFSGITHQYLNNRANDAPYTVTVTVTDKDGGSGMGTTMVTVQNVAPTALMLNLAQSTINEGSSASLSGSFTDPGTLDAHTVTIDWNDGSSNTVLNLAAGSLAIPATMHVYKDNLAMDAARNISVTVEDDGAVPATNTTAITVLNVAPGTPSANLAQGVINENDTASLSGSFTDPGVLDTHDVVITWGDGNMDTVNLAAGVLTYNKTHQYLDNKPANAPYTITVHVVDKDAAVSNPDGTTSIEVDNVAPSNVTLTANATVNEQGTLTLDVSFSDPGTLDTHHVVIDWGDPNNATQTTGDLAANVLSHSGYTHVYTDDAQAGTPSDTYIITVTITDKDNGTGSNTRSVAVLDVAPSVSITGGMSTLSSQYSDPVPAAEVVATDNPLDTPTATTSWGPSGNSLAAGLPPSMGLMQTQATDAGGVTRWSLFGTPQIAPGTYVIRVAVTDEDTLSNYVDFTLIVDPEDARVQYTGPYNISALGNATSVVIPLKATVKDITALPADPDFDSSAGEIRHATVTFVNRGTGTPLTPPIPVVPSNDPTIGTVSYNLTVPMGGSPVTTFELEMVVGGYYTRDEVADDVFLTLQQPQITTGVIGAAGSYVSVASGGSFPAVDGSTPYFGINATQNGASIAGSAYLLYRTPGGVGLPDLSYLISIPSLTSLTIPRGGLTAHVVANATIYDVTDSSPVVMGTGTVTLDLVDRKGAGADTLAIAVTNGGTLLFSSRYQGGTTVQTPVKTPGRINLYFRAGGAVILPSVVPAPPSPEE